jgi:solute:Na+ symporter, SSS family
LNARGLPLLGILLVCFGSRCALSSALADSTPISGNNKPWVSFSDLPIRLPDSSVGAFVGGFQDRLIIFGGRNVSSGTFDEAIYFRDHRSNSASPWQSFKTREARAFGCSAIWMDGLICIGGMDANGPSRSVTRIFFAGGAIHEEPMPQLPFPLVAAGAAVLNDSLFIFGGARGPARRELSGELLKLDLNSPNSGWTRLATLPAEPRFMSTVCAQGGQINIFGGYRRDPASSAFIPTADAWAYRPTPVDGTKITGWIWLAPIPFPLAGAAAWPTGQSNVMLCGGASTGGYFTPLIAGIPRGLNHQLLAYNTVTDSFADVGTWDRPLFGSTPVSWDSRTILVNGRDETGAASNPIEMNLQNQVRRLSYLDYGAIAVYFALFAAVGALFARKQTSSDNFALGGRSVKWWLAGISLYATGTSAISYMAIPAQTFSTNIIWWVLPVPLAALALLPQAYLVVPLIRRLNVTSTYEYLERRFNPALRLLASAQCIVFQIAGRMAVVMLLPAFAISAVTGISLLAAVLIMGSITTIYTAIGGIDAVIWTDAIQTILTIGGPLLALVIIFTSFDGHPTEVFSIAARYSKFKLFLFDWNFTLPVFWIAVISTIFSIVGFAGDQTMVQRVLCTSSAREARRATLTLFVFVAIGATLFHFLGIAAFSYFHAHPNELDPKMFNDQIVPLFIVQKMPIGIAGLIIASIFGASMSTLSGTINSVATLVSEDFYRRINPAATDRRRLRVMKITSYVVGILSTSIACYMAMSSFRSVFETWNKLIALLGGGFVGVFTLGMFTTRANAGGAIFGAVFSVLFTLFIREFTPLHWTLYAPAAIGSCVIVGYLASFLFPPTSKNLEGLTVYTARPARATAGSETLIPVPA